MRFKHIAIFGVGLIGGSFALAARRARLAEHITGWDKPDVLDAAREKGIIDNVEDAFDSDRMSTADLVYLAAPVGSIIEFLRTRGSQLKPGAIVTDAGSTKREICLAARGAFAEGVHFVAGHPMAGSHHAGLEFASKVLFRDAPYAVVINDQAEGLKATDPQAVKIVTEVVEAIGSRPIFLTPEQHDRLIALVSHAPQLLSTALAITAAANCTEDGLRLAGAGFSDMARLAESHWSVWEDICRTNRDEIAEALGTLGSEIDLLRAAIQSGDFAALRDAFESANEFVKQFQRTKRNRT